MAVVTPPKRGDSRAEQPEQPDQFGQRIDGAESGHHGRHRAEDRAESVDAGPATREPRAKPVDGLIEAHSFKRRGRRAGDEFSESSILA
jgi:hypothetical protein